MSSWFDKCMPKIKDVMPYINEAVSSLKHVDGVKSVHIWGSYAKNIKKPNTRIKDVDILAKTNFHSGDLLAVDKGIVESISTDNYLENQGYDPLAIKFSQKFLTFSEYNVDCWAISRDRKLVHWGPICTNKQESEHIGREAEKYAYNNVGIKKDISKSAEHVRNNWYNHYCSYLNQCFEGMPTGWYKAEDVKVREIISQAIKI